MGRRNKHIQGRCRQCRKSHEKWIKHSGKEAKEGEGVLTRQRVERQRKAVFFIILNRPSLPNTVGSAWEAGWSQSMLLFIHRQTTQTCIDIFTHSLMLQVLRGCLEKSLSSCQWPKNIQENLYMLLKVKELKHDAFKSCHNKCCFQKKQS